MNTCRIDVSRGSFIYYFINEPILGNIHIHTHLHIHTHNYIYIYIVCVCMYLTHQCSLNILVFNLILNRHGSY